MRKNIFIKSMLRQRLRSFVLMLLIAAAAFTFVMRTVEYIVLTDKIEGVGGYYRSIGYLQYTRGEMGNASAFNNALAGAEIVSRSPYVGFEDRRRGAAGQLQNVLNSNHFSQREQDSRASYQSTDVFFYGTLISKTRPDVVSLQPYIELIFLVDNVLAGYPENASVGQELMVCYYLTAAEREAELAAGQHFSG